MRLAAGTRLGPYEIAAPLGAGGMGEVYRARDARLERDVAIKVLPDAVSGDPERLARFEREAKVLAALNHPHIAALYGLEECALIMELVEGPTLAERIAQGPVPLEEALAIARQIAEAAEYAHEKGIVHRDLKPANVKITPEGTVKVLDFGLAKIASDTVTSGDPAISPTLTMRATQAGVIIGTAAYMAPEQAKGKTVDRRADIWAFGVVLLEMLTGRQTYTGDTIAETLASVMKDEPAWDALRPDTPPAIRRLLRRCLDKDPKRRLRDIGEARIAIEEVLSGTAEEAAPAPQPVATPSRPWLPWSLAALGLVAASIALWGWLRKPPPAPLPVMRWTAALPNAARYGWATLSPDGSHLAYLGGPQGSTQLYVRQMDQLEAKPLSGTENAFGHFFSPDGQWIGYLASGKLKKVPVTGGASITLCDAPAIGYGASWGPDDTIVFCGGLDKGLMKVPAAGGKPQVLTAPDPKKGESAHAWPYFLPDGKAVLFTIKTGSAFDDARIGLLNLRTGERRVLLEGGANARYVPTGHLVYARAASMFAVPFDLGHLQVKGSPAPVLEGVSWVTTAGFADYSFSGSGTLVYVPGGASGANRTLAWVDRKGTAEALPAPPHDYLNPRLSPDGKRVAVGIRGTELMDIWVYEVARGTLTRLTFEFTNSVPTWTPDGKRVTFWSSRSGKTGLFWVPADGSGSPEALLAEGVWNNGGWSPDGKSLVYTQRGKEGKTDLWVVPGLGEAERKPRPFLQTQFDKYGPCFSPDGRWMAYESNESGRFEVYVQPFPGPGGKWQVSTDSGRYARWAANGRELFYRNGDKMMAVEVETSPAFRAGTPKVLFEARYDFGYDVSPDGKRFLMVKSEAAQTGPTQVQVVQDWFEELKRRLK